MTKARIIAAALVPFVACTAVWAQEDGQEKKWSVGALGLVSVSPFAGEDTEILPVPYLAYRGERFYLEGLEAGYHLVEPMRGPGTQFVADVIASARMTPGTSRDKVTLDAGLRLGVRGKFGSLTATGLHDVTGEHDGMELRADYSYTFMGDDYFITPSVGISWQNRKLANHMWGVTADQHADMIADGDDVVLPVYQLDGSAVNYEAGLTAIYLVNDRVNLIGFSRATYLDKDVRANPAIEKKYDLTIGLGIAYSF
ncbi:MAG: MipA/OmpV family protein [Alphaproteobacteria bacterium]|nr:MipA/OmpV family protein [Alphaproteobacteria bacterium]